MAQEMTRQFIHDHIPLRKTGHHARLSSKPRFKKSRNNAFGTICFQGFGLEASTNAPYVRVSATETVEERSAVVANVWKLMTDYWNMREPKLIISVTGGAKNFYMKNRLRINFKRGLMKAATSAEAWIITGGTKTGVMEIVGEAVQEYNLQNGEAKQKIVVLGIATWGIVANRTCLQDKNGGGFFPCYYNKLHINPKDKESASLDPNHTHFILVDNALKGEDAFGGEISFRTAFEKHQAKSSSSKGLPGASIPVVLLVLEGGRGTLETVYKAVEQSTPVVVIDGSGRAADFIAFARRLKGMSEESAYKVLWDEADRLFRPIPTKREDMNAKCVHFVQKVVEKSNNHLLTVIKQDDEDSGEDIDQAIITALIKANRSNTESQLDLALAWNRCDIARQEIFSMERMSNWREIDLNSAMFTALVQDKDEFVNLFIDSGLDLRKFLTIRRLHDLYKEVLSDQSAGPSVHLLRNLVLEARQSLWLFSCKQDSGAELPPDLLTIIGQVINDLSEDQRENVYRDKKYVVYDDEPSSSKSLIDADSGSTAPLERRETLQDMKGTLTDTKTAKEQLAEFEYTERELFIWALLLNRKKLAMIFWKSGQDHISGALTASMLLKALAHIADREEELDLSQELFTNAHEFESLAVGVLNACYQKDKELSHDLLIRELDQWGGKTLFVLADAGEQMDFMEHTCCQTKLNRNWKGKMALYTPMWKIVLGLLFPLIVPFIIKFTRDEKSRELRPNEVVPFILPRSGQGTGIKRTKRRLGKVNIFLALYYYYTSPVVKFCFFTISYLVFLGLFSFFMLTDMKPNYPSIPEFFVYGWVLTMWLEEVRQILTMEPKSLWKKLSAYFYNPWNRFDQFVHLLFVLSVVLRFRLPEETFLWARMSYSITLSLYFIRFLQFFYIEKNIGPKVVMIRRMFEDLLLFIAVLAVFIIAYGVSVQILLYPNSSYSWEIFKQIVMKPYFQMYGEMFFDEMNGDIPGCSDNSTVYLSDLGIPRCPQRSWLVMILFAIYLILTNILLINLLIAMFSYTFSTVQDKSEKVWRFYRYSIISEYFVKPSLAPPLIIFSHVWRIVKRLYYHCTKKHRDTDFRRKLNVDENRHLAEFERSGVYIYYLQQKSGLQEGLDYKLTNTGQRVEKMLVEVEYLKEAIPTSTTTNSHDTLAVITKAVDNIPVISKEESRLEDIQHQLIAVQTQMDALVSMIKTSNTLEHPSAAGVTRVTTSPLGIHQIEIKNFDHGTFSHT